MKKGVIIELKGNQKVILGDNGRFYVASVKKGDAIGSRVKITSLKTKFAAIAFTAVFFLGAACGGFFVINEINAMFAESLIRIEINPSLEFLVNNRGVVISSAPLNKDAAILLADNDYSGKNIGDAVSDFAALAISCGFISLTADYNPVFVYSLSDKAERQNKLVEIIKQKLESVFNEKFIRAVVINNLYHPVAESYAESYDISVNRYKAVYTVAMILKQAGDKRPIAEIMEAYKDVSTKNLCNIILQAHIKYGQSISSEQKQILVNAKKQQIKINEKTFDAFYNNPDTAINFKAWLTNRTFYEQQVTQTKTEETFVPLYTDIN